MTHEHGWPRSDESFFCVACNADPEVPPAHSTLYDGKLKRPGICLNCGRDLRLVVEAYPLGVSFSRSDDGFDVVCISLASHNSKVVLSLRMTAPSATTLAEMIGECIDAHVDQWHKQDVEEAKRAIEALSVKE